MDTPDTVDKVPEKKRGRPKKQDPSTPMGDYIADQANVNRKRKDSNRVVEKYYELQGDKLRLITKNAVGSLFKKFEGSLSDKTHGPKLKVFVEKLKDEGRLRIKI